MLVIINAIDCFYFILVKNGTAAYKNHQYAGHNKFMMTTVKSFKHTLGVMALNCILGFSQTLKGNSN